MDLNVKVTIEGTGLTVTKVVFEIWLNICMEQNNQINSNKGCF